MDALPGVSTVAYQRRGSGKREHAVAKLPLLLQSGLIIGTAHRGTANADPIGPVNIHTSFIYAKLKDLKRAELEMEISE